MFIIYEVFHWDSDNSFIALQLVVKILLARHWFAVIHWNQLCQWSLWQLLMHLYKNVCLFSFQIWAQNRTHHFHKIGHQIHLAVSFHSINSDSWRRFLSPWLRCLCILLLPFKLHCFWMFALLDLSITSWCPDSRSDTELGRDWLPALPRDLCPGSARTRLSEWGGGRTGI